MVQRFNFDDLFVLDLANNHQGSIEHGLRVVREHGAVVRKHGVRAALKFQFRQLDTFIHPGHVGASDNKHVGRFLSTRLDRPAFEAMRDAVRAEGMLTMCTPFDEESVDVIVDMGFDILKVASCSARDWPLLEKISEAGLPVVFSTGGLTIDQVDDVVSFFDHRGVDFAMMYCVSIYPIPDDEFHLGQIGYMRERYNGRTIGWSTHETPAETAAVQIALAQGARMFERHVGVATDDIKLNAYSSTPAQVDAWLAAYTHGRRLLGGPVPRAIPAEERESIESLSRGVFARTPIRAGETVARDQVYFAMPPAPGALESGEWRDGIVATCDIAPDQPLDRGGLAVPSDPDWLVLKHAVHETKALLNQARVPLDSEFEVEFSHHYGIPRFRETGVVIINCINRDYCKKVLVQLPGQAHPLHFHKRKEETFQVLLGTLHVTVDGHERTLQPGQTCLVQPGVWHSFRTDGGCVFEEISTTHYNDDSFYQDKAINRMQRFDRKTVVDHWGRFQIAPAAAVPGITD